MHRRPSAVRPAALAPSAAASVLLLATAGTAGAGDGPMINVASPQSYSYKLTLLPDIDQRRDALPGNGSMYCVPTSVLNLCAYAGNHGFGDEVVCDDVWMAYYALDLFYDDVTFLDLSLGFAMATDPDDGTNGSGGLAGAQWAMGGGFMVLRFGLGNGNVPNFDQIANVALGGGLVAACVGWYEPGFATTRDGGHCLSVARLARSGEDRLLGVHDPGTDENPNDLDRQSAFTREDYGIVRELRLIDGVPLFVDRVAGLGSADTDAIIDSFYAFIPYHAYHWGGKDGLIEPQTPQGWPVGQAMQLNGPGPILDLADDPANASVFVIQQGVDVETNVLLLNTMQQSEVLVLEETELEAIAISRSRHLYTLDGGNRIARRRIRGEQLPLVTELQVDPDAPLDALLVDDRSDTVLALAGGAGQLREWPADLLGEVTIHELGTDLPGDPVMALDPVDGIVWFATSGAEFVLGLDRRDGRTVAFEHGAGLGVTSLAVTPEGNLLLGDGSVSTCITTEGVAIPNCRWAAKAAGGPVHFPRSTTNHDPATMEGPAWRNVPPTVTAPGIAWCRADLDGDDLVGVGDLLVLLAQWDSSSLVADLDADGSVGVSDLIDLLAGWGPCP